MDIYFCNSNVKDTKGEHKGVDFTFIKAESEEVASILYETLLNKKKLIPNSFHHQNGYGVTKVVIEDKDSIFNLTQSL